MRSRTGPKVRYPPGRPPTPAKQKTYYKGRLAGRSEEDLSRKLLAAMSPEQRDKLGRRAPRMLPRGVREMRALEAQQRAEDIEKSGFYAGRVKT